MFFAPWTAGAAPESRTDVSSLEVIERVKRSGLRGRGGAGFPDRFQVGVLPVHGSRIALRDPQCGRGEPGTFKDRVLMTERAEQVFEGMAIAGYRRRGNARAGVSACWS